MTLALCVRSRSICWAGGSDPTWNEQGWKYGHSSTVLLLLLTKQEARLLSVSVLELLAKEAATGMARGHKPSRVQPLLVSRKMLGLSKVESCFVFQGLGVGEKTTLGSGRWGNSPGSQLGLGVVNTPAPGLGLNPLLEGLLLARRAAGLRAPSGVHLVTTGLHGGREGDVGGSQGLVRASFEALHSDIDHGVVGAGSQGWGLHR